MSALATTGKRFVDPATIVSHFHIREGDHVADFGAGGGFYIELLAKKVGGSGRVYACDIQKELVEKIGVLVRQKGLFMVDPLWCDMEQENGIKIPNDTLDVGLLINTFFQLEERKGALKEIARTLRSGGKLFIVDWSDSFSGMGPHREQIITEHEAKALCEEVGFVYERSFDAGDHHYGLGFRKV